MKPYSTDQNTIAASQYKRAYWLFEFNIPMDSSSGSDTYNWSTQNVPSSVYNSTAYSFKVIPKTFSGIELQRSKTEEQMFAPTSTSFSITNKGNTLSKDTFEGQLLTIRLVISDGTLTEEMGTWIFNVDKCIDLNQTLEFECVDPVTYVIDGDYPKNREVSTIEPSVMDPQDGVCLPETFGTAYIPIRSQLRGDSSNQDRYYFLGLESRTFTISEVRSPRETGQKSVWTSANYTFTQSVATVDSIGYRVFQPIIDDSDGDGIADACGVWTGSNGMLDIPTKLQRTDGIHPLTNPADVIQYILENMGIDPDIIDSDSNGTFSAAATTFDTWGLVFNGGFWKKEPREKILAMLLNMCHSTLQFTDKIELHVLVKASQKTITSSDIIRTGSSGYGTFRHDNVSEINADSGHIEFQPGIDNAESQDLLVKYTVPAKSTMDEISENILSIPFVEDSQDAKRIGSLFYQRKLLKQKSVSFKTKATLLALQPDDFITINDSLYGGNYLSLIDSIKIDHDLSIQFSGTTFSDTMDDWDDISPDPLTIADEQPSGWQQIIVGPDATVDAGSVPNALAGRLWVGDSIAMDPFTANLTVYETPDSSNAGSISRVTVGLLSADNYGIEITDFTGLPVFKVNSTEAVISSWNFDADKLYVYDSGGTAIALNGSTGAISINNETFSESGFQVQYNAGSPRLYIGNGNDQYMQYENSTLTVTGVVSGSTVIGGTVENVEIVSSSFYSDSQYSPPSGNLQLYLKLDETSGTTVYDSSPNEFEAKMISFRATPNPWHIDGKINGCFDTEVSTPSGSADGNVVAVRYDYALMDIFNNDFTISMWVRIWDMYDLTAQRIFMNAQYSDYLRISLDNGYLQWYWKPGTGGASSGQQPEAYIGSGWPRDWYHLVYRHEYDSNGIGLTITMFWDGEIISQEYLPAFSINDFDHESGENDMWIFGNGVVNSPGPWESGFDSSPNPSAYAMTGRGDEFRLYNKALTDTQIQSLKDAPSGSNKFVLDSLNGDIHMESSTFGDKGFQLQYNNGHPRLYVGDGNDHYMKFDGYGLSFTVGDGTTKFYEDSSGDFFMETTLGDMYIRPVLHTDSSGSPAEEGLVIRADGGVELYYNDTLTFQTTADGATITGIMTMTAFAVTPSNAPTTNYQVANKKYVDDEILSAGGGLDYWDEDSSGNLIPNLSSLQNIGESGGGIGTLYAADAVFTGIPTIPITAPTLDAEVASKKYVDDTIGGSGNSYPVYIKEGESSGADIADSAAANLIMEFDPVEFNLTPQSGNEVLIEIYNIDGGSF